jgi:hypothetical protein
MTSSSNNRSTKFLAVAGITIMNIKRCFNRPVLINKCGSVCFNKSFDASVVCKYMQFCSISLPDNRIMSHHVTGVQPNWPSVKIFGWVETNQSNIRKHPYLTSVSTPSARYHQAAKRTSMGQIRMLDGLVSTHPKIFY